ncbi:MAG: isoprenylcysteine carboxylmethyltransferase family protein [Treponema sp.]|jgi:protein-S-isoprenylcysteine O-methyltransferase Ste14|nr:isoprenylcysteine carboxylmethyltransferase family protein [Treponema sp.]
MGRNFPAAEILKTGQGGYMDAAGILALISMVIFYVLFIGRTVLLYKKGVRVWVIGVSAKRPLEIILENILFPVLALWTIYVLLIIFHVELPYILSKSIFSIPALRYAGILLCYAGLIIFFMALLSFGKAWRIGIDEKNSNELITGGIFRYSRNPIFLFMDMYFTGMMLVYPTVILILTALGAAAGLHLQILREEKFLLEKFGEKYAEYKKHTRRYL